jgi:hypothetical protein
VPSTTQLELGGYHRKQKLSSRYFLQSVQSYRAVCGRNGLELGQDNVKATIDLIEWSSESLPTPRVITRNSSICTDRLYQVRLSTRKEGDAT